MNINEFIRHLDGLTESGEGKWMARCPAHDDSKASMSVSEGRDGKILVKCFAGCSAESIVGALGLKMSDLMGEEKKEDRKKAKKPKTPKKMVAAYEYQDASGATSYRVCRYEPKTFCAQVYDPDYHLKWRYGFTRYHREPLLYHLPQILAAAKAGKVIFLAEGEKDVDALIKLGVTATTAPFGAQRPWLDSFTASLKGARTVVICADNDPKEKGKNTCFYAGQRRAWSVGQKLEAAGLSVIRMVFPQIDGKPYIKDAYDWISAGGTREALVEILKGYVSGENGWPEEWRFTNSNSEAEESPSSPTDEEGHQYKLTKNVSVAINVDPKKPLRDEIEYWMFKAWKALSDAEEPTKIGAQQRKEITEIVVVQWLSKAGRLFWNDDDKSFDQSLYFTPDGELMSIASDAFQAWLAVQADMNLSTPLFKYISAAIDRASMDPEISCGTVPAVLCDRRGDALYISCGNNKMVRILNGKVEELRNGSDGVVFMKDRTFAPWELLEGDGVDPFDHSMLFKGAAFESDHGRMLVRLWTLSMFGCLSSKPVICITGRFQSGKTRMAKGIFEMTGAKIRLSTVKNTSQGELDFWCSVDSGGLLCFDNVDTKTDWFSDAIQAASTGAGAELRKLYKQKELTDMKARASIMLTSNNPQFARESGLSDRLIIVRLDKSRKFSADGQLTIDFEKSRDQTMTWIVRTLAKAMQDKEPVEGGVNMRHPDFANFALRCGRALGLYQEAIEALRAAEIDKALFPVENDTTAKEILRALVQIGCEHVPRGWEGTSSEISEQILSSMYGNEILEGNRNYEDDKRNFSSRRIGKALDRYSEEFQSLLKFHRTGRTKQRSIVYRLEGESSEFYKRFSIGTEKENEEGMEMPNETHPSESDGTLDEEVNWEELVLNGGSL